MISIEHIYTLFHNSAYRLFYSVGWKSYDPRLIISYQPRRFYEFDCKGFHKTKKVLIAVWPLSVFSEKCVDEKTSVERSQSRTGNSIVRGILQGSVIIHINVTLMYLFSWMIDDKRTVLNAKSGTRWCKMDRKARERNWFDWSNWMWRDSSVMPGGQQVCLEFCKVLVTGYVLPHHRKFSHYTPLCTNSLLLCFENIYQVIPSHEKPHMRWTLFDGYLFKYCSVKYQTFHQVSEKTSHQKTPETLSICLQQP